jgi:tight adherence protein B
MTLLLPALLLLGVLIVAGAALSLALMEVNRTRRARERRVGLIDRSGARMAVPDADGTVGLQESDWRQMFGKQLRRLFSVGLPRTWGMSAGASALILTGAGAAGITWSALHLGLGMSNWIAVGVAAASLALVPRSVLKIQQRGADQKFVETFPDTIDMAIRMLRAGVPITGAVRAVGDEAPPPVNAVFTNLADQMAIGITLEDALATTSQRIGLADFRFFAVAITLQRVAGGNLATTLDVLSDLMRKRRAMRLKAKASTGEVRMSAYVLGAIPFLVIGGLLIMTPDYLRPLIVDPRGRIIIAAAVASLLIGFGIIRQMMRSVTRAI